MKIGSLFLLILIAITFSSCSSNKESEMLQNKIDQFVKTELEYDESLLDENQKIVVQNLFEAAKIIDQIFLEQVYSKNSEIKSKLANSFGEKNELTKEYFQIMFGPFDRLDHNKPFIGNDEKPKGANFYPEDMTKEEFDNFVKDNPDLAESFTSEYTVIRRENGTLTAIPYTEFYKDKLVQIISLLREAADYADNPSLKKYLLTRAKAFETNDYFESDVAWMDLKDHRIEVIIGPYEVYEDELFNYKAAFECFLTLVDPVETKKLEKFSSYLVQIEKNLPLPQEHKNYKRGSESPIVVVQEVFSAGDTKAGVQTLAFNLPNDERVRKAKGSKKVMIKNMHEAKFNKLLKPISEIVLNKEQQPLVTFDAFFNHTLMHEMSHGVGPGYIEIEGRKTEVKKELKETYSTMEEMKADVLGMYNNIFMLNKGEFQKEFENEIWATFLAGVFRSVRFGISEAHGGGTAIIYNYLLEKGGYEYNSDTETVKVNYEKIYGALEDLVKEVLMIQATGSYSGAQEMIAKYRVESPSMVTLINKLKNLPVDINPVFEIAKK